MTYIETFANKEIQPVKRGPVFGVVRSGNWMWGGGPSYMPMPSDIVDLHYYPQPEGVHFEDEDDEYFYYYMLFISENPISPEPASASLGWIAPDGRFFSVDLGDHMGTGSYLACQEYQEDSDYKRLLRNGWVAISSNGFIYGSGRSTNIRLTDAQRKTAQEVSAAFVQAGEPRKVNFGFKLDAWLNRNLAEQDQPQIDFQEEPDWQQE